MLGGTIGKAYTPSAPVTTVAGPAPPAARSTRPGALLRLSKTTPEGSISRVVVTDTATLPQCVTFAVTTSLRSTSRTPSPEATGRVVASAVGTSGWMRNRPVLGAVSVAANVSVSPVN